MRNDYIMDMIEDYKEIVNNTEFRGEAADAIKTYFKELWKILRLLPIHVVI